MPNVIAKLRYYPVQSNNAKISARRSFYSSGQNDDYMGYIDKGGKAGYKDYMGYAGAEEKSAGVFDKNGLLSKEQKKEIRKNLRNTKSVIWDLVISFKEYYGNSHLKDIDDAKDLLNARLNRFFKQAGLNPENIMWYAGLHENTDNRHIHISFFEREPQKYRQTDRTKKYYHNGNISKHAFDGLKISVEQYFSNTATRVKGCRKQLLEASKNSIQNDLNYNEKLHRLLVELYERIPSEGHISYMSDGMASVRGKADEITSCLLRNNPRLCNEYTAFKYALKKHDDEILEIAKRQKIRDADGYLITEKTISDLYRRMGNKVIQRALLLKKEKREEQRNSKRKHYESKKLGFLILESARLGALVEQESIDFFQEFLEKLEEANYKRIEEEMEM